jgi:hypothetical protein
MGQRAESLRHGTGIDHREHRQPEGGGEIGAAGLAVEQAHHTLDEDQVCRRCRGMQQATTVRRAAHEQVELMHRPAAGTREDHRVDEVGARLEHAHAPAAAHVGACDGGGHARLALAGCRGADHQRRTLDDRVHGACTWHGQTNIVMTTGGYRCAGSARKWDMGSPDTTRLLLPRRHLQPSTRTCSLVGRYPGWRCASRTLPRCNRHPVGM